MKKVGNLPFPFSPLTKNKTKQTKKLAKNLIFFEQKHANKISFVCFLSRFCDTHEISEIDKLKDNSHCSHQKPLEYKDDEKEQQQRKAGIIKCTATTTQSVYMYCNFLQQPRQLQ